jgi:wyosine [tRNA(Phe)-imidazoG37] synthetase (radical SAM superfamily)
MSAVRRFSSRSLKTVTALRDAFASHPRRWRDFRYVYPVISRRSNGLSVGVNLNPEATCNFDCVYCCAQRPRGTRAERIDLDVLEAELRALLGNWRALFDEPEFRDIPEAYRRLNDIAFSGDGEPTIVPEFSGAIGRAARVREELGLRDVKVILITNACQLARPKIAEALALLDGYGGEVWAKLDAGTEEYFQRVNRARCTLHDVLKGIRAAGLGRPIVLQSLFLQLDGEAPPETEIAAYVERVAELVRAGVQIRLVQVYTVARQTAEANVAALEESALDAIAERVRQLELSVKVYA